MSESKDLQTTTLTEIGQCWSKDNLPKIREVFAPTLNNTEFEFFIGLGMAFQLNPFKREIWAVKYDQKSPAQIFIGRDGYRVNAQRNPDYKFHHVDAVYSKDVFKVVNGEPHHEYNINGRGVLMGAYCTVEKKSSDKKYFVYVEIHEYSTDKSLWKGGGGGKPATMIKKVAEAQALRLAFPEVFNGTYSEFEEDAIKKTHQQGQSQTENAKEAIKGKVYDAEVAKEPPPPVHNAGRDDLAISNEQIEQIAKLIEDKGMTDERHAKALAYHRVDCVESMTDAQARLFILQLQKL